MSNNNVLIAECLSARQLILHRILEIVSMYVCYSYTMVLSGLQVYTSGSVYIDHEGEAGVVYVN